MLVFFLLILVSVCVLVLTAARRTDVEYGCPFSSPGQLHNIFAWIRYIDPYRGFGVCGQLLSSDQILHHECVRATRRGYHQLDGSLLHIVPVVPKLAVAYGDLQSLYILRKLTGIAGRNSGRVASLRGVL